MNDSLRVCLVAGLLCIVAGCEPASPPTPSKPVTVDPTVPGQTATPEMPADASGGHTTEAATGGSAAGEPMTAPTTTPASVLPIPDSATPETTSVPATTVGDGPILVEPVKSGEPVVNPIPEGDLPVEPTREAPPLQDNEPSEEDQVPAQP